MKIVSITVTRKDSVRIPNKAQQKINSHTLLERKVIQLKKVKYLNQIIIGSNDEKILNFCKKYDVTFVKRDEKFCNEELTTPNEMIKNMLNYVNADVVVWSHLTNPFISEFHYNEAINIFLKNKKKNDSLFSVSEQKVHFWSQKKEPINHNPFGNKHVVARDLPSIYKQNGGIFIRHKNEMLKDGRFIGNKPFMYIMDEITGWDLDYRWQLEAARHLVKKKFVK
jgi:CMP-N-acetylneuraminic acid synthetase